MRWLLSAAILFAAFAQSKVDFEMMTWREVKDALAQGKTTALVYNGGTEQRGPQAVNGGHTLMAHATVLAIAERLGNAIAAPVLPFSVNNASAAMPGTIGITPALFSAVNQQAAEQLIVNGFKNVVLMGDHGDGQRELAALARKLNARYGPRGIRVVYCGDVYARATADFNQWLAKNGYPVGEHAGIADTSEMLYLGGEKGWVRKEELPHAFGPNTGIRGDARRSSAELGKRFFDMKVDYAVREIRDLLK